eukprot:TRINITY_DN13757_c0_g1_i9.p1 TRINITY_DN13757_c0_g1~~TRINITY_DN13757_c0_g1_i9.p1  ORF type:complete len:128 (+),score=35.91 TRINITY_DN13757_c0_g1_i9:25-384(+)
MIRRPPRSTHCISSAASDVYKRQELKSELHKINSGKSPNTKKALNIIDQMQCIFDHLKHISRDIKSPNHIEMVQTEKTTPTPQKTSFSSIAERESRSVRPNKKAGVKYYCLEESDAQLN